MKLSNIYWIRAPILLLGPLSEHNPYYWLPNIILVANPKARPRVLLEG